MSENNLYKIGAVSRLTGIPTVTIRMWERRYQLVTPQRTEAGGRLYSQDDLHRLGLVKQAVDAGNAISTVATLSNSELQDRLANTTFSTQGADQPIRVTVIGEFLSRRLQADDSADEILEVVQHCDNVDDVTQQENGVDVVVMECDYLSSEVGHLLQRARQACNARAAIVVYSFGAKNALEKIENLVAHAIKGPLNRSQLSRACVAAIGLPNLADIQAPEELQQLLYQPLPARRFSPTRLAELAEATDVVKCECPQHLAELIKSLHAFEQYSAHCENQSKQDAAMHMLLHVTTAKARRLMEDALNHLVEYEGTTEAG